MTAKETGVERHDAQYRGRGVGRIGVRAGGDTREGVRVQTVLLMGADFDCAWGFFAGTARGMTRRNGREIAQLRAVSTHPSLALVKPHLRQRPLSWRLPARPLQPLQQVQPHPRRRHALRQPHVLRQRAVAQVCRDRVAMLVHRPLATARLVCSFLCELAKVRRTAVWFLGCLPQPRALVVVRFASFPLHRQFLRFLPFLPSRSCYLSLASLTLTVSGRRSRRCRRRQVSRWFR